MTEPGNDEHANQRAELPVGMEWASPHVDALGAYAMATLGQQEEADGALIAALLAARDELIGIPEDERLPMLFGIARRKCARRRPGLAAADAPEEAARLRARLVPLRPTERDALLLRYTVGLSARQTALAAGVDEATARGRISRALGQLCEGPGAEPDARSAWAELSGLLDEDDATRARHASALERSDSLRDALHEAQTMATALQNAGVDYVPSEGLYERLEAALPPPGPVEPSAATTTAPAALQGSPRAASPALWLVLGALCTAVLGLAGGGLYWAGQRAALRAPAKPTLDSSLEGRVLAHDSADGLTLVDHRGTVSLLVGDTIGAGATLRTDMRTRAEIGLSDGSTLTLDRGSEVILDAAAPRRLRVLEGSVYLEVAHLDEGPGLSVVTPHGVIDVRGTTLLVAVNDAGSSARVLEGTVAIRAADELPLEVRAGEEGLLPKDGSPSVGPAVGLAASAGWTELDAPVGDAPPMAGLGELRARRPGEREESERPLRLERHSVKVRIAGNIARTEIEETFTNDGPHTLEGIYAFPLPPGARIASLALEVDGRFEEGAFVARERAAKIWRGVIRNATPTVARVAEEEFLWVPGPWRDPALLEWKQGGRFELRIFPIPARGSRSIRIAYEQNVAPHGEGRRYVYPLPHGASDVQVGRFEADVRVAGAASVTPSGYALTRGADHSLRFAADDFQPAGSLVVDYVPDDAGAPLRYYAFDGSATAMAPPSSREGDDEAHAQHARLYADGRGYVAFALRPELPRGARREARDYVLAVDASQSMVGERYERAVALTQAIVGGLDRRDRFVTVACDATCRSMDAMRAPHASSAAETAAFLRQASPAGASHIAGAIGEAFALGRRLSSPDRTLHVIYIGDGLASTGPRRASALAAEARELRGEGALTTVGIGHDADATILAAMAREGGGHFLPFIPGQRAQEAALAVLETTYGASIEGLTVTLPAGITDVAPRVLPNVRAGEELWIVGRVTGPVSGTLALDGRVGDEPFRARYPIDVRATSAAGNAFVPRLWASATIADLELSGDGSDTAKIVALSKAFHVMSRETSLLVLESEAMFRAFGVDRSRPAVDWSGEEPMEMATAGEATEEESSLGAPFDLAPRRSRAASAGMGGLGDAFAEPAPRSAAAPAPVQEARRAPMPLRMRRVRFLEGHIASSGVSASDHAAVTAAQEALLAQPDSRDRHRALVRALSRASELERAAEAVDAWLVRDALDAEALTYKSDVLGRLGQRAEALRILGGVVDLERDSVVLHERLAAAFERSGERGRACDHRVALAEIVSGDAARVGEALRCERARGRSASADRLLRMLRDDAARARAEAAAARPPSEERVAGPLVVEASWSGGDEVDLSLVTPQGTRLSWMGGRTSVVADQVHAPGAERLGLRRASVGGYLIEVNRTGEGASAPIRGTVHVRTRTETRRIPFELVGDRAVIGRVDVVRRFRLEPAPS